MNSLIMIIVNICQLNTGDPAHVVAKEQMKCQAYYSDCLAKGPGLNEIALLSCMASRPASELYDKVRATTRLIKPDNAAPNKIIDNQSGSQRADQ